MDTAGLQKAINLAGSQSALASLIDKRQSNISTWLHRDNRVPAEAVIPIAAALDYQVTPHELRPDLYPHHEDGMRVRAA
jgi:DNA-binding transcriptional regulator YdaS (Cro superfamily)